MLTDLQHKTAQAIVHVFETGRPTGGYDTVTLLPGDTGHLTYGKLQTTLGSGNLFLLINRYCAAPVAAFAEPLRPYLGRLRDRDTSLDQDAALRRVLREAGSDPVMKAVQDAFFDDLYWHPAVAAAQSRNINSALGTTVVFDSFIHGSWRRMRDRTDQQAKGKSKTSEQAWIALYLTTRRDWLANHANPLLPRTVYRIDALQKLTSADNWALALPITVRGQFIDEAVLDGSSHARAASDDGERLLMVTSPMHRGDDVKALQQALNARGESLQVDGVYGHATAAAVRRFQGLNGLRADGIVGAVTRTALGMS